MLDPLADANAHSSIDTAGLLDDVEARYSLEIQKHRLVIAKLRAAVRNSTDTDPAAPDMVVHPRRAA